MKKIIKLTENDLMRIVKRVIIENMESEIESNVGDNKKEEAKNVIKQILTPDEINFLANLYQEEGERNFKREIIQAVEDVNSINLYQEEGERNFKREIIQAVEDVNSIETGDLTEEEIDNMSDEEYKLRSIVDKIIAGGSIMASLGIVPAAMFVSGGAAAGLAVATLLGTIFKDAAWWKRDRGHYYSKSDRSRKDWY